MFKRKCDCPSCRARAREEFAHIVTGAFSDEDVTRIANEALRDFDHRVVYAFAAGHDINEEEEDTHEW